MESFLIKALQLVVALVILVTIHEFGHYIFARMFGVKVNRFYLFFNPGFSLLKYDPRAGTLQVLSKDDAHTAFTLKVGKAHPAIPGAKPTWRDTIYGLGWLPLGGYCDIAGMIDETKSSKDLAAEPQPWEFRTKAAWKRLLVMVAGVLFNFLLAIAIYIGIAWHWGEAYIPFQNVTEGMDYSEELHSAGFKDGDRLVAINHKPLDSHSSNITWDMIQPGTVVTVVRNHADSINIKITPGLLEKVVETNAMFMSPRVPVMVQATLGGSGAKKAGIQSGDRFLAVGNDTTPTLTEFFPALTSKPGQTLPMTVLRGDSVIKMPVEIDQDGKIGIQLCAPKDIYDVVTLKYDFLHAIPKGWNTGVNQLTTYIASCKLLFTKAGAKSVGGFGTLGNMFPEKWNWLTFWQIAAFLSVILAFMNIIPIPGLDGGYTLFLIIEMITRRKPSMRFIEVANMIGMGFLLLLLVYANLNDAIRFLK